MKINYVLHKYVRLSTFKILRKIFTCALNNIEDSIKDQCVLSVMTWLCEIWMFYNKNK